MTEHSDRHHPGGFRISDRHILTCPDLRCNWWTLLSEDVALGKVFDIAKAHLKEPVVEE